MKKRILPLVLALLLAASLTGCAGRTVSGEPYKMYMIVKSTTTEFWKSVFAGANAAKSEYNVDPCSSAFFFPAKINTSVHGPLPWITR